MKKVKLTLYILGLILLGTSLNAQAYDTLINKAMQLFETRHLNSTNIDTSANILESVIQNDTNNLVANYKLAQVYYTIADHSQVKQEKLYYFNKGIDCAKKAMQIDSNSVWGHFWYMANLGSATQMKGIFSSLASVSIVKREIDIVLKLDSNNVWGLNAKANLYYELPGILGGDLNKSIEILNHAVKIDSNYSILYVSLAKAYIKKRNYDKARLYLNKVLTLQNPWPIADYVIDDKPTAVELLKKIENK